MTEQDPPMDVFEGLKKKKKKAGIKEEIGIESASPLQSPASVPQEGAILAEEGDDAVQEFDFGSKKKKKKNRPDLAEFETSESNKPTELAPQEGDYSYPGKTIFHNKL